MKLKKPTVVLTDAEKGLLAQWNNRLGQLLEDTNKNKRWFAPRVSTKLRVVEGGPWHAVTGPLRIKISKDCLTAPVEVRDYLLAHELGHCFYRHSITTMGAGVIFVLGFILLFRQLASFLFGGDKSAMIVGAAVACVLLGLATMFAYSRSMLFEWAADNHAKSLIGLPAMLLGIAVVRTRRQRDTDSFYENKICRLKGEPAAWLSR